MSKGLMLAFETMKARRMIVTCLFALSLGTVGCDTSISDSEWEEEVTFSQVQGLLISRGCTEGSCHSGDNPAGGLALGSDEAYAALVNQPCNMPGAVELGLNLVTPGEPDESFLYVKLTMQHADESFGLPMPMYGDGLSVAETELVRRWIESGAPR